MLYYWWSSFTGAAMDSMNWLISPFQSAFNAPLFPKAEHTLTFGHLLYLVGWLTLLIAFTGALKKWAARHLLPKTRLDLGVREAIASGFAYATIAIGSFVILDTAGIDLNVFIALAGALGLGLSMGLQTITNNFVSGLVILIERPIKVGDRVEVGSVAGNVTAVGWRSTTILTNDNIAVIVPNSEFISAKVTNRTYNDRDVRIKVSISVSYGSDPQLVADVLLQLARLHHGVLQEPHPDVLFQSFGDSALNFVLRVWTRDYTDRPDNLESDLNNMIFKAFREHGIEIPYPRRDIQIRSTSAGTDVPISFRPVASADNTASFSP